MNKIYSKFLLVTIFISMTLIAFGQRGYDYDDSEEYNWHEFDPSEFFMAALICAAIIILGLFIIKNSNGSFFKGLGTIIIVVGCLGALVFLGRPIIGAITMIWQVVLGAVIFLGGIYWVYAQFIDKK